MTRGELARAASRAEAIWSRQRKKKRERRKRRKARRVFDYAAYLRSPQWDRLKRAVYERDRGFCRECGAEGSQVHHLRYDRLGREELRDLTLLCGSCHLRIHGLGFETHGELSLRGTVSGGVDPQPQA